MSEPKIALIGGASGTGKTSATRLLTREFGFHHSLGTGFIREICKNYVSIDENSYLHKFSFDDTLDKQGYELLFEQSIELVDPINSCISRAKREGTSLAIEGVNILPELYNNIDADVKIILISKEREDHASRCRSDSHSRRVVTEKHLDNSRSIQQEFITSANKLQWPILECTELQKYLTKVL